MRWSNGVSDPLAASVESAPVTRAERNSTSASNRAARAWAVENCVPFRSARPSLGPRARGLSPASARAAAAGLGAPSTKISPTPIMVAAMCASGARSPDAPTEPCPGITGVRPRISRASSRAMVCGCTPEAPWARLASFRASISRTIAIGVDSPTPAEWESTMFRCSVARSQASIRTLASFPKPVLMP